MKPILRPCRVAVAAFALFATGCRPAVNVADPSPFEEDDPAAAASAEQRELSRRSDRDAPPPITPEPAAPRPLTGQVGRAELDAVLDRGIGALIHGGIEVDPRLDLRNRFLGWEVVRFAYKWVDIRPGDVVSRINGHPLGKPTEVQALWDALRTADEIVVRGERGGASFELRFAIVGPPRAPATAATP